MLPIPTSGTEVILNFWLNQGYLKLGQQDQWEDVTEEFGGTKTRSEFIQQATVELKDESIKLNDTLLERSHCFIQTFFPLNTQSGMQPITPYLDAANGFQALLQDPTLKVDKILKEHLNLYFAFLEKFRTNIFGNGYDHNHARISRMIQSVVALEQDPTKPLLNTILVPRLKMLVKTHQATIPSTSITYWHLALKNINLLPTQEEQSTIIAPPPTPTPSPSKLPLISLGLILIGAAATLFYVGWWAIPAIAVALVLWKAASSFFNTPASKEVSIADGTQSPQITNETSPSFIITSTLDAKDKSQNQPEPTKDHASEYRPK